MTRTCATALLALALLFLAACGVQKASLSLGQIPAVVQHTFHQKFPSVANPDWSLKSDKNYEAEFTQNQVEMAVKIDPAGKWLETETTIPLSAVPQPVQNTAAIQFKDYKIIETQTLLRAGTEVLTYELHLDNGKQTVKAEFSAAGAILAQSAKPKP